MTEREIVVSASVVTKNQEQAVKAAEVFGRAAIGLVLDGVAVNLHLGIPDDDGYLPEVGGSDG